MSASTGAWLSCIVLAIVHLSVGHWDTANSFVAASIVIAGLRKPSIRKHDEEAGR